MRTGLVVHSIRGLALALAVATTASAQTPPPSATPASAPVSGPRSKGPAVAAAAATTSVATTVRDSAALIRGGQSISALGNDLFGDTVNLYTGSFSMSHTDVSLPGNSALPVALGRNFTPKDGLYTSGAFGDWDLAIPSIGGQFAVGTRNQGWDILNGAGTPQQHQRCTTFGEPEFAASDDGSTAWEGFEYWQGTNLNVPGAGGGEVLWRGGANSSQPTDGQSWPLVTKSGWQLRCLASLHASNINSTRFAKGEGFIAKSPSGTTYRFDWLVVHPIKTSDKVVNGVIKQLIRAEIQILPTLVTDAWGNTVTYNYNPAVPTQLTTIVASDGRQLSFTYVAGTGRVQSVSDGSRTWTYGYTAGPVSWDTGGPVTPNHLTSVTQPDGSTWQFSLQQLHQALSYANNNGLCPNPTIAVLADDRTGTITHPSGAVASFTTRATVHGRKVATTCTNGFNFSSGQYVAMGWSWFPMYWASRPLVAKSISGPGMASANWSWIYPTAQGGLATCTTCPDTKSVTVTDPRGVVARHTFGIYSMVNEGQLLQLDEAWNGSSGARSTSYRYRDKAAGPYPSPVGASGNPRSDALQSLNHTPLDRKIVNVQGASFTWLANSFDFRARALSVTRSSSLGYSKSETTAFHDNTNRWVLGQVGSVADSSGAVERQTTYDLTTALPLASLAFGLQLESYSFYTNGLLNIRYDAGGRATTYTNYMRGIPQNVAYPDATSESAVVNSLGLVTSITNGAGTSTGYGYDAMGRLASITPPGGDPVTYHPTTLAFERVAAAEYGIAGGHWRQTLATGNARTIRYFEGLWRERLSYTYDTANPAATGKAVETRYDTEGRNTFTSYAQRNPSAVDSALPGTASTYDNLGRKTQVRQDSELGLLTSTTAYLSGFTRQVTNPRGFATTTSFVAWDEPTEDLIAGITAPEAVNVAIVRDAFGKPRSITRSGGGASATRSYVYDGQQRLCKTIEPESGATVQAWDSANNIAWRASGLALPSTTSCDQASAPAARRISYGYDTRNRLTATTYGDASAGVTRSYTADGQPLQVSSAGSTWTYGYNNRRLMVSESLAYASGTYAFTRGIDAYGNLASLAYPGGPTVAYSPDALGRPTQASGYASAVAYQPNGAIAGYTLANGVVHSSTQTTRGLPLLWRDAGVVQDLYAFDANGNVTSITDQQEGLTNRSLGYDGLDRLTSAFGIWGAGSFGYDALDNLRTSTLGARSQSHNLDAATNRLASLTGSQSIAFGYDANGNVSTRGTQAYAFDIGNRMASAAGKASYAYDGHGRRIWVAYAGGSTKLQVYGQAGKLLYSQHSAQGNTRHIFLGDRLIAETNSITGTSYSHTDALGSPVAKTNGTGALLSRTRYEPYGATAAGTNPTGIGFTGHVNDADTGLVYMQQRYQDPVAGRFLSVDPVVTDASTGELFNRYNYAYNNPYRFKDPDGRFGIAGAIAGAGYEAVAQWAVTGSVSDWKAVVVAGAVGAITGGLGNVAVKAAASGATTTTRAVLAAATTSGAAAAGGKHAEGAWKGLDVSAKDVGIAAAGGVLGGGGAAKIAVGVEQSIANAAAKLDNVSAGIVATTVSAIKGGGPTQVMTTAGSAAGQQAVNAGAAVGQKVVEERMK